MPCRQISSLLFPFLQGRPASGEFRVLRGGSYFIYSQRCRAVYRFGNPPERRYGGIGFRLVLPLR
ncbi:SUMF1/EgtB/PvdO family nonheme iron enzyme [Candidatus Electronema sp. JC]|uniref:SUMF1/EgtB/PvdO family nonheme iron enzyme n=1 Tax=Candidatus Electronema sp. JC TaxID=3401570 RepID=UPI003AA99244